MTWEQGLEMKNSGKEWIWESTEFQGPDIKFEFKLLVNDRVWEDLGSDSTENHNGESFKLTRVKPKFTNS